MLHRVARAYGQSPASIKCWEYWDEYVPAVEMIVEIPLVDELVKAIFAGKKRPGSGSRLASGPLTKEERQAAFDNLKKEAERRRHG